MTGDLHLEWRTLSEPTDAKNILEIKNALSGTRWTKTKARDEFESKAAVKMKEQINFRD